MQIDMEIKMDLRPCVFSDEKSKRLIGFTIFNVAAGDKIYGRWNENAGEAPLRGCFCNILKSVSYSQWQY